jgi:hypothetical protein
MEDLPFWQTYPVNAGGQAHEYCPSFIEHVPPLIHGLKGQGVATVDFGMEFWPARFYEKKEKKTLRKLIIR